MRLDTITGAVDGNVPIDCIELQAVAGVLPVESGRVVVDGTDVTALDTRGRRRTGMAVIPDDREGWAITPSMTVAENLAMTRVGTGETARRRVLDLRDHRRTVAQLIEEYEVRPPDPTLPISALSGGNRQKVVVARELERKPSLVLVANPTQGLDIGAAALVHRKLLDARNRGAGVLLVTSDIDELLALADRLVVLFRGRVSYRSAAHDADPEAIAQAMAGTLPATAVAS